MQLSPDEIIRLSSAEQLALIAQLRDSLADVDVPSTSVQNEELDRRLGRLDQGKALSVSWDTLKAETEQR